MARFYADAIVRPSNPTLIPQVEEDLAACLIDGADDCGVDFLARSENVVLIIQAKYSGGKKTGKKRSEDPVDFDSFCGVLSKLYAGPTNYKMNGKLREAISDIDFDHDAFDLRYITLFHPAENSHARLKQGVSAAPDLPDLGERSSVSLLDEEQLNVELRDAISLGEGAPTRVSIRFTPNEDQPAYVSFENGGRISLVGRVTGSELAEIYKQNRSRLFALNIRNYVGDNGTNRAIRKTALTSGGNFFFFNNGISALATRIEPDPNDDLGCTVICEDLSIVNGAQTVKSLSKAQGENPSALRKVEVLIRISETTKKRSPDEQEFLDNVTKFNNTQNAIKISDFRSNDPIQQDLVAKFANLPARSGRKFIYKNKRSGERDGNRISINMEEFTKTIFSFQYGPDDVWGGTSYLFNPAKDFGYSKLYGHNGKIARRLDDNEFRYLAGIWFLCDYVKGLWRSESERETIPALERRWMVFFAVGESLRTIYALEERDMPSDIRRLADPSWNAKNDAGHLAKTVIKRHCDLAFRALRKSYEHASEGNDFRHRNWFRQDRTLAEIRSHLQDYCSVAKESAEKFMLKPTD